MEQCNLAIHTTNTFVQSQFTSLLGLLLIFAGLLVRFELRMKVSEK